jgi:Na+-translocating ferredoxin:NAD+ oxidoreductase RNF subunit RnfB
MSIIQFKEANCKNCYKCIRSCPVKAIGFKNEQARIVEEDCMLCGNCLQSCPQNAKTVKSDIETVKNFINKKEKVYVSLAPSFISAFEDGKGLFPALKKLGLPMSRRRQSVQWLFQDSMRS